MSFWLFLKCLECRLNPMGSMQLESDYFIGDVLRPSNTPNDNLLFLTIIILVQWYFHFGSTIRSSFMEEALYK